MSTTGPPMNCNTLNLAKNRQTDSERGAHVPNRNIYFSSTAPRDLKGQTYRIDLEF